MTRPGSFLIAFAVVFATAGSALAQPSAPGAGGPGAYPVADQPFSHVNRDGLVVGFSIGGGSFGLDECFDCGTLGGVAASGHLGLMVTQRLGLMWDASLVSDVEPGGSITHAVSTAAAQYWMTPHVWIKAGLGFGNLSVSDEDGTIIAESETGAAAMLAAGVELLQAETFAIDLQLRGSAVTYSDNDTISMGSLSLGFNWY